MKLIKGRVYKYKCSVGICIGKIIYKKRNKADEYKVDVIKPNCQYGRCPIWYVGSQRNFMKKEVVSKVSKIEKELYGLK